MQFHPLCDIIEAIYSMDASICEQLDRFHFVLRQNAGLTTRDALDTLLTAHFRLQLLSSRTFAYATRHEESHAIAQHIPILMQPLAHVVKRVRHPDQARQTSARALISMILSADSFLAARVELSPCSGFVIYSMHPLLFGHCNRIHQLMIPCSVNIYNRVLVPPFSILGYGHRILYLVKCAFQEYVRTG